MHGCVYDLSLTIPVLLCHVCIWVWKALCWLDNALWSTTVFTGLGNPLLLMGTSLDITVQLLGQGRSWGQHAMFALSVNNVNWKEHIYLCKDKWLCPCSAIGPLWHLGHLWNSKSCISCMHVYTLRKKCYNKVNPPHPENFCHYLPRQRRGRGNRIGPVRLSVCVCVCVCVSVSALTTEPLDLRTQYLVQECT